LEQRKPTGRKRNGLSEESHDVIEILGNLFHVPNVAPVGGLAGLILDVFPEEPVYILEGQLHILEVVVIPLVSSCLGPCLNVS